MRISALIKQILREYAEILALAIVLALFIRIFIFSPFRMTNETMNPNLLMGDYLIGFKLPYGIRWPWATHEKGATRAAIHYNQVLIFKCPGFEDKNCIKRVVALSGDRVQLRKGRLFINQQPAQYDLVDKENSIFLESWRGVQRHIQRTEGWSSANWGPLKIPPGSVFLLSDNRGLSSDVGLWGPVPMSNIHARAWLVWFSVDWSVAIDGGLPGVRWSRIFSVIQ